MKVRFFDYDKDYQIISEWYSYWKYLPIPKENLPIHGLIVSNGEYDIGAAWLYVTDGKISLIEGAILNPKAPRSHRKGGHAFLIECMKLLAKDLGCLDVWVISKDPFITSTCKKLGFYCFEKDFKVLTIGV